jgi:hypothetical protein
MEADPPLPPYSPVPAIVTTVDPAPPLIGSAPTGSSSPPGTNDWEFSEADIGLVTDTVEANVPQDADRDSSSSVEVGLSPRRRLNVGSDSETDNADNTVDAAARRYNQLGTHIPLGRQLALELLDVMNPSGEPADEMLYAGVSLREECARKDGVIRRLSAALDDSVRQQNRLRVAVAALNSEFVRVVPRGYQVGNYDDYRRVHERLEIQEVMNYGLVPGGFRHAFAWQAAWDAPFVAPYQAAYLQVRNGRRAVQPRAAYRSVDMGVCFAEFANVSVSNL